MSTEIKSFNIRLYGTELEKYNRIKSKVEKKFGSLDDNKTFRFIINEYKEEEEVSA